MKRFAAPSATGRILFSLAFLLLVPRAVHAQAAPDPSPTQSAWGPLPADTDSTRVAVVDAPRPAWETALMAPWRVLTFPIALASRGIGVGLDAIEREEVFSRVGRLFGPRSGPFAVFVTAQAGGNPGWGGGLVAEHTRFLGGDNTLRARASTTTREDERLGLAARFHRPGGEFSEIGFGYRHRPNVRYFGLGPDTKPEDLAYFHQQTSWMGVADRRRLGRTGHVEARLEYSTAVTGAPDEEFAPSVEIAFPGALPPGFDDRSRGLTMGAQWMRSSTDLDARPERGSLERFLVSYFEATDDSDVRFWRFRGEAQRFVTLGKPQRVLALRGVGAWIEEVGDDATPAPRLHTNDDPDLLRGYDDFRWRDRGIAFVNLEYRWPMWRDEHPRGAGLDAYLLADVGQVFGHVDQLALDRATLSWGGGLRLVSTRGFLFRLEYARSDEDHLVRLSADQVFQFVKTGYIHGREPIPAR